MSTSPAWDDINPTAGGARIDRATRHNAAQRIRHLTDFAAQLTAEGQFARAKSYLQQAIDLIEKLKS